MGDIVRLTPRLWRKYFPSSITVASQMKDLRTALETPGGTTKRATYARRRASVRVTTGISGRWKR